VHDGTSTALLVGQHEGIIEVKPKEALRSVTPPILWSALRNLRAGRLRLRDESISFAGDYASFEDALAASGTTADTNYQQHEIDVHTVARTREALEEQVPMSAFSMKLLAALQHIALEDDPDSLRVIDFGGAMGIHYFEVRRYLSLPVNWHVVELARTARRGNEIFANDELRFHDSLKDVGGSGDVVLASGSLQYTSDPCRSLSSLQALDPRWMIVDRVPLIDATDDRLTVQRVPPTLYEARYPAWFFSRERFEGAFAGWIRTMRWLAGEYATLDGAHIDFRGFLFRR
jgi:putative methyltransferase (TIGR04325 family)